MFWNLLAKVLIDLVVGLIIECAMMALKAFFFQERQVRSVSLA
jgi:hypothetical protein